MERVDCIVAGAGVVGLAVARALARAGREVLVLEAADAIGTGISSRSSEVIHAGIYYPEGSLKAQLCVAGRRALYAYCESHGVPFARTGKLIVATREEEGGALGAIGAAARANGVHDLRVLGASEARAFEPELRCVAALLSPSTGIVDSHRLMLALQGDLETLGGLVALRSPVSEAHACAGGLAVLVAGRTPMTLACNALVNCAGLGAQRLARAVHGMPPAAVPALHMAKGNYFVLRGRSPFRHLVYPVPEGGGLGVHSTLDLGGQTRFGPDVEWVAEAHYTVTVARGEAFYPAIRRYWPGLRDGALQPGYAGIRPKLARAKRLAGDFVVSGPEAHGVAGLWSLFGVESPGLTASLALGDYVAARVSAHRPARAFRTY